MPKSKTSKQPGHMSKASVKALKRKENETPAEHRARVAKNEKIRENRALKASKERKRQGSKKSLDEVRKAQKRKAASKGSKASGKPEPKRKAVKKSSKASGKAAPKKTDKKGSKKPAKKSAKPKRKPSKVSAGGLAKKHAQTGKKLEDAVKKCEKMQQKAQIVCDRAEALKQDLDEKEVRYLSQVGKEFAE